MVGCNFCTCFSGELMCTKKQCASPTLSPEDDGGKLKNSVGAVIVVCTYLLTTAGFCNH